MDFISILPTQYADAQNPPQQSQKTRRPLVPPGPSARAGTDGFGLLKLYYQLEGPDYPAHGVPALWRDACGGAFEQQQQPIQV